MGSVNSRSFRCVARSFGLESLRCGEVGRPFGSLNRACHRLDPDPPELLVLIALVVTLVLADVFGEGLEVLPPDIS